jgi:ribonuclease HI
MFLDGVSSKYGSGIEIVFVSPSSENHVLYFKLGFETTNNVAKYEALILGLEVAKK